MTNIVPMIFWPAQTSPRKRTAKIDAKIGEELTIGTERATPDSFDSDVTQGPADTRCKDTGGNEIEDSAGVHKAVKRNHEQQQNPKNPRAHGQRDKGAGHGVGVDQAAADHDMGDGKTERSLKRKIFSH